MTPGYREKCDEISTNLIKYKKSLLIFKNRVTGKSLLILMKKYFKIQAILSDK